VSASVTIRSRVDSTDLLRGTVMILMALDHTQDFFSAAGMNPRDVTGPGAVHQLPQQLQAIWPR
jgi:uncharacterized membrane protein